MCRKAVTTVRCLFKRPAPPQNQTLIHWREKGQGMGKSPCRSGGPGLLQTKKRAQHDGAPWGAGGSRPAEQTCLWIHMPVWTFRVTLHLCVCWIRWHSGSAYSLNKCQTFVSNLICYL